MPNELMKTLTIGANTYDLPQKTSDLTNDSGFITSESDPTVPSWAKASSKPTYTASEVGAAASSHTHGNITNGGDITTNATIASGDRIIINDESASKITNSSITFGSSTTQYLANNGTWQNVPTVPTKTSDLTNDNGFITSESDPAFTASAAHDITSTDITNWNNKAEVGSTSFTLGKASAKYNNGSSSVDVYAKVGSSDATCIAGMVTMYGASVTSGTSTDGTFNIAGMHQFANKNYLRLVPEPATAPSGYSFQRDSTTNNATTLQTSSIKTNFSSGLQSGGVDVLTQHQDLSAYAKSEDLASVATSGDYNDLSNKPTIPAAVTESTVAGWGFTKNTGTYSKPSGGIPKTDLASAVQTSLGKADTALQSYTESDPIFTASAAHGITSTNITNWNNKISEPASEGTNGQVLMTNGSGTRTWGSVSTADEKIKLTSQSTSGNYPLIFGPTSITSNSTYQGYYNTGITINPNTKAVTATTFVGALTGTASGNLTSSSTLDASKLSGAIPSAVTATTQTSTDNSTKIATTAFVQTAIDNLPEPMVFKGSLGTGGTITSLPTASTSNTGYTYKVITAGTYASQSAKIGDTFISDGSAWILIPSGDEPSGTVTSITLKATSPISIDSSSAITTSGTRTLSHADSGVTAGTYKSVTVDSKGHVTAGSNPSETDPVFTGSAAYGISSSDITNWNGKTSNTGTVTSVRVQATSPVTSSVNTAQSSTLNTTIALADGYGDTKNPYASKTKNYVLAAPSNANGVPSFRALVADDIPSLTKSKISDFPTIPTKTSDLTNDSGFITTDEKVKQTAKSDNVNYKLLFTTSASPTSGNTAEAAYDTDITINPSTNTITATNFSGKATSAAKLTTARSLKTKLDSTTAVTFDGSAAQDAIPVTGTLPIGNGGTGATTAKAARENLGAAPTPFVKGTQTASTNVWIGDLPSNVTAYYDGLAIDYFLPYAGTSTAATLNLGGLGAKPVYVGNAATTGATTHFPAQSVLHLTYIVDSGMNSGNGCWKVSAYQNTTYSSKAAASGGTAVSLVTTGEKYTWNNKATKTVLTATIPSSSWSSSAPYTKSVTVTGLLATDTPIMDLVASTTYATAQAEIADYANIYKATCTADTLKVYATSVPTHNLSVQLVCMR